jgi:hypothetical protein
VGRESRNERRPVIFAIRPPYHNQRGSDVIDAYLVLRYRRLLHNALGHRRQYPVGNGWHRGRP